MLIDDYLIKQNRYFLSDQHRIDFYQFVNAAKVSKYSNEELDGLWRAKVNMHLAPMKSCYVISDIQAYESPATGKMITSRSERREDFKVSGSREWEGIESEKRQCDKDRKHTEVIEDKKLDHAVREAWAGLSDEKKAIALAE